MSDLFGFTLINEQQVPDINTLARLYRHEQTGAELLSLINDDENKCFGIAFRTPPTDSTGIAHIMEHSVLCGSRKFPVKEPFVELLKSSLNTFLNALTFPDKTVYPVASQNLQDFYNLIDVYLDAVFYPLIPPHILEQEGWHYELENIDDPLSFKGVVYNEMKGSYSSPTSLLGMYSQRSLYPDNAYKYDSGGDPKEIPNLTYEQFKNFHETYYHPSNARIYFYGDDDPEERLKIIRDYLKDFEATEVESQVQIQPSFGEPRREIYNYDAGEDSEKKGMVTVNWLLPDTTHREKTLTLSILDHILIGTPASPLRKALIDSGLGEDLTGGGLEAQLRQMHYSVGLKGIAVDNADRVETLVLETLEELANDGIDPKTVDASLNTIEFRLRENNTGGFPRGLLFMLRSLSTWIYDADPIEPLAFEESLMAIKKKIKNGEKFFETLIHYYFLGNSHRTTVILKPDQDEQEKGEVLEKKRLAETQAKMDESALRQVIENTEKLKKIQETPDSPEALSTLPFLKLEDIDKENKLIPREEMEIGKTKVLYHDLFTNGILYLDVGFNMHGLPQELIPYFPLFSRGLVEIGTETEDFVTLTQRIGRKTGGLYPTTLNSPVHNKDVSATWLFMRGKGTMAQADDLLDVLHDILLTVNFDNQERFRQMVLRSKASKESSLVPGGHRYVNTRLKAHFNESDWVSEQMGGISNLFFVRRLVSEVENEWGSVLEKLEKIHSILINRRGMICNVTLDAENWNDFQPKLKTFINKIPERPFEHGNWSREAVRTYEGFTLPAQVNYVGKGGNLFDYGYNSHGSTQVIQKYLGTTWLWEKVRVQGGAYGGFAVFNRLSGVFGFISYRDPNLLSTLDNYDRTSDFLRALDLSQDELTKSIIGTIGDMDTYQLPDAKGYTSLVRYLTGVTNENRQQLRDEVLATSQADFKSFTGILEQLNQNGHVVVMGSEEAVRMANEQQGGKWLKIEKVL